ncbi:hypothetical protein ACFSUJ_03970 [Streptomyces lusitanus]|uniref:Uncharacterized protein n=1 Tax=Streptomyces lusitanus TaxID=68232 RepID=A0ABU3JKN2_9ACTN|nr:hypothetical protein [Streptomyces lusitanus]
MTMSPPRAELEPTAYHRRTAARCSGMDSTETARRLLGHGAVSRPYAQLTGGHVANTPIYAELVAEWRAKGHTVPGHLDGLWASFAVVTANDRGPAPHVPFRVPVPLLGPGTSEAMSDETPDETSSVGVAEAPEEEAAVELEAGGAAEVSEEASSEPDLTSSPNSPDPR